MDTDNTLSRETGVICRRNVSSYLVRIGTRIVSCRRTPASKDASGPPSDLPAGRKGTKHKGKSKRTGLETAFVGDRVRIRLDDSDAGWITEILPRRNRFSRRSPGAATEQVLAANIDQILACCALEGKEPEWHMLDRFLAAAEIAGIPVGILLTKSDLLADTGSLLDAVQREIREYRQVGYPAVSCSVRTGQGREDIQSLLQGKTTLLLGKSGVGKTSLVNALFPEWDLPIQEINRFGEGRCTTSNAELYALDSGAVVDTPGVRKFTLWGAEEFNPAYGFREMRPLIGRCRFGAGCRHSEEPGCAIRRALEEGRIGVRRFRSMLHLAEDHP